MFNHDRWSPFNQSKTQSFSRGKFKIHPILCAREISSIFESSITKSRIEVVWPKCMSYYRGGWNHSVMILQSTKMKAPECGPCKMLFIGFRPTSQYAYWRYLTSSNVTYLPPHPSHSSRRALGVFLFHISFLSQPIIIIIVTQRFTYSSQGRRLALTSHATSIFPWIHPTLIIHSSSQELHPSSCRDQNVRVARRLPNLRNLRHGHRH